MFYFNNARTREESKPVKKDQEVDDSKIVNHGNIFDFFQLPAPKDCDKYILSSIKRIANAIKGEAKDNNDFFFLLRQIDKASLPVSSDRLDRIDAIVKFVKTYKGDLRKTLNSRGYLALDIMANEAKESGNWTQYLKLAEEKENEIRSARRKR